MNLELLKEMCHSKLQNYIIPGVASSLVAGDGFNCGVNSGVVRLFECSRDHQESVAPHSHRFDFQALVLRGRVTNRIWRPSELSGDPYMESELIYKGMPGQYERVEQLVQDWAYTDRVYSVGDWYEMTHDQVHSIKFSRDAIVLMFEGPPKRQSSIVLEPYVDGKVIPTSDTQHWMFRK